MIAHLPVIPAARKVVGTGRHQRTAENQLLGAAAGAGSRPIAAWRSPAGVPSPAKFWATSVTRAPHLLHNGSSCMSTLRHGK